MSDSRALDRALVAGLAWTGAMRWLAQVISWVATLYAARKLQPGDYGIVSMAMIAIGLARMVEDFGLDAILVQDRTIRGRQQAQIAGLILILAAVLCCVFLLIAHPVAAFFREPQVAWAISLLSLLFITDALQVIPRALLQRDLAYARLSIAALVQTLVTQAILVECALHGFGFRSLVLNTLGGAVAVTTLLLVWRPYAIAWPRNFSEIARSLLQGWRMLASRGANYFYLMADQTIIGRVLGKEALGAYSFAQTLSTTTIQEVSSVVTKVVPGIFSAAQERRDELRRYFLMLTEFISYLTLPMCVGLALTADVVVPTVLGPNWESVIGPLRILCLYTAFSNAQLLISHVMIWTGQFRAQMWCTILTAVGVPVSYLYASRFGLEGIAWALAIVYPLTNIPPIVIGFRTISIGVKDWLGALFPSLASCVAMSLVVIVVRTSIPPDASLHMRCALMIAAGAIAYCCAMWLFFRARLLRMIDVVRNLRQPQAPPAAAAEIA
jgi:O-antigen/teichoic acid export membrane protein